MRVCLVAESFDLDRGGAELSLGEMGTSLVQAGQDVTLVAGKVNGGQQAGLPFPVELLATDGVAHGHTRVGKLRAFERAVRQLVAAGEYDIIHSVAPVPGVHVYQPRGGSVLCGAKRHAESYELALVRVCKAATSALNRARQARIVSERRLCSWESQTVVAALSEYVQRQFVEEYGLDVARVPLIRNGVAVERFRSEETKQQGDQLRRVFDRRGDIAIFVFAAVNLQLKGLGWLLEAAARACAIRRESQRDFRIIVLTGSDYGSYWRRARRLGLGEHVVFMESTDRMAPMLRMCDAAVLPTFNDACSRVIMEALAAGRPGITTRFNGAAEFLGQGRYGIVLDRCGDVDGLAEALLTVCERQRQAAMVEAIDADRVFERVSMRRHAEELIRLYEALKQGCNGGGSFAGGVKG